MTNQRHRYLLILLLALAVPALPAVAQNQGEVAESAAAQTGLDDTLGTLHSLLQLQAELKADIRTLSGQLEAARSEAEKRDIQGRLEKLEADLQAANRNLKEIAAGADIGAVRAGEERPFNLQEEVFALLRPALKEMKDMTSHVRQKSDLKDRIDYYEERLPVAELAVANLTRLLNENEDASLESYLQGLLAEWQKQLTVLKSELRSARLQLDKLEDSEASLAEASQSYLKAFFQRRGLYLTQAVLAVLGILLLSRLVHRAMVRLIPGYRAEHRSFRIRLLDLIHRILTALFAIMGPMVVFYLAEDWVLFSLGILLLLGIGLTLRHALPRYWQQVQLFLNIGTVREGERISLDGLPWRVRTINIFSILENPTAALCKRVRIDDLVDLKSRPCRRDEPWFPCTQGDWVLLNDGMYGKVVEISEELVELVALGGAHRSYPTADFLSQSPLNLSRNFRISETIGISYNLQKDSVTIIPRQLREFVETRLAEAGYSEQLHSLKVEFQQANTSSLDLAVIADFAGSLGHQYMRLRRAIQGWCVEACTAYHWEIPFTQLTLHQAKTADQPVSGG